LETKVYISRLNGLVGRRNIRLKQTFIAVDTNALTID